MSQLQALEAEMARRGINPPVAPQGANPLMDVEAEMRRRGLMGSTSARTAPTRYQPVGQAYKPPAPPLPQEFNQYAGNQATTLDEIIGQRYGETPVQSQQVTYSPQTGVDPREQQLADVMARIRYDPNTSNLIKQDYQSLRNQAEAVIEVAPTQPGTAERFGNPLQLEAQRAAGRLQAESEGRFTYQRPEERVNDIKNMAAQAEIDRQQRNVGRAESLGEFGLGGRTLAGTMAAGDTGTFGLSALARGDAGTGELAGLGGEVQQQFPVSSLAGSLAGGAGPVAKIAGAGAGLAGSWAARAGAGQIPEILARSLGGFVAGNAATLPQAYIQAVGEGASQEQALEAVQTAAMQYPNIVSKLRNGEVLDENDYLAIAFLIPEYIGARGGIKRVMQEYRPRNAMAGELAKALDADIGKTQLAPPELAAKPQTELVPGGQPARPMFEGDLVQGTGRNEEVVPRQVGKYAEQGPITADTFGRLRASDVEPEIRQLERRNQPQDTEAVAAEMKRQADEAEGSRRDEDLAERIKKLTPLERAKARNELHGRDASDPRVAKLREMLVEQAPAKASLDEVASYVAHQTEDPTRAKLDAEGLAKDIENETTFQRGNIEYIDHRDGPMVMVDVPLRELDYTESPNPTDVGHYAKSKGETAPPIVAGPVRKGDAPLGAGRTMLVTDGKHRTEAARQRGESTIKAYVPEWYAKERGFKAPGEKPRMKTGPKPKGLTPDESANTIADLIRRGEKVDRKRAMELIGARNPDRAQAALNRARDILKAEQEPSSAQAIPERQADQEAQQAPEKAEPVTDYPTARKSMMDFVDEVRSRVVADKGLMGELQRDISSRRGPNQRRQVEAELASEIKALANEGPGSVYSAGAKARLREVIGEESMAKLKKLVSQHDELSEKPIAPPAEPTASATPPEVSTPLARARQLFEPEGQYGQPKNISPVTIRKELGVTMNEAMKLADQLKQERRAAQPKPPSAKPLPRGGEEVEGAPEQVADYAKPFLQRKAIKQNAATMAEAPQRYIARLYNAVGMGAPGVGKSKVLKRGFLGWFKAPAEVARMRRADDPETAAHEFGHFLHKLVFQNRTAYGPGGGPRFGRSGLVPNPFPTHWNRELERLGRVLYGNTKPTSGYAAEGWAEVVRLMMTNPAAAQHVAPTVYAEATRKLNADHPDVYQQMQAFQRSHDLFVKSKPAVQLDSYIRHEQARAPKAPWLDRMRILWEDSTFPMLRLKKDLGLDNLSAAVDPHVTAKRYQSRVSGQFRVAVQHGMFDPATGQIIGPSLSEIITPVRHDQRQFQNYLTARRILEKRGQGYKGLFEEIGTAGIRQAVRDLEAAYPAFKQAADQFQEFNRWLIGSYAVHHGLITAEQAAKIIAANLDYATFAPVHFEDAPGAASGSGPPPRFTQTGTGIRRFPKDMGGKMIEPPLEAFMASMEGIMSRAQRNAVGQALIRHANVDEAGRWFREIDRPTDVDILSGQTVSNEVKERLSNAGFNLNTPQGQAVLNLIAADDFKSFKAGFRVSNKTREFSVLVNGKPKFFEASDGWRGKMLHDFLAGKLAPDEAGTVFRLLRVPRTILRAGATLLNPDFFVYNFPRDLLQAAVMSTTKGGQKDVLAAKWKAMIRALGTGDPGHLYKFSGAEQSGLYSEYVDPKTKKWKLDDLFEKPRQGVLPFRQVKEGKLTKALVDMVTLGPIQRLNNRFELATRLMEFEGNLAQQRAQGKIPDVFEAGQAAADITLDYASGGKWAKEINQGIPFFNAAFLGGSKLARYAKEHPVEFARRVGTYVVLPSLVQHIMNRNNPAYWNQPQEKRDRYWLLPLGDTNKDGTQEWLTLPKPYGLGVLALLAERTLARLDGFDPVTNKRTGDPKAFHGVAMAMLDQFRPPLNVPLITPIIEMATNHSFYQNAPIVRQGEQLGPKGERGAERSSEFAAMMGGMFDVEPPLVDHAIQGMFAGLGSTINKFVVDPAIRTVNQDVLGQEPRVRSQVGKAIPMADWPVIRRLITEEPRTYSETLERFWDQWQTLEDTQRGLTRRINTNRNEEADAYEKRYRTTLEAYDRMRPYKAEMEALYKELKATYQEKGIDELERDKKVRKLLGEINDYARQGIEAATTRPQGDK